MEYYVYILANDSNTTVYTGVTRDLFRRLDEHRRHVNPHSFTARYNVHKLVYFESTDYVGAAIDREKQIKGWNRKRKNELVASMNPRWENLMQTLLRDG